MCLIDGEIRISMLLAVCKLQTCLAQSTGIIQLKLNFNCHFFIDMHQPNGVYACSDDLNIIKLSFKDRTNLVEMVLGCQNKTQLEFHQRSFIALTFLVLGLDPFLALIFFFSFFKSKLVKIPCSSNIQSRSDIQASSVSPLMIPANHIIPQRAYPHVETLHTRTLESS